MQFICIQAYNFQLIKRQSLNIDSLQSNIQMIAHNLLKPPRIIDDADSHQSDAYTCKSNNRPAPPKNKRKENTLRIGPSNQQFIQIAKEHDNESVHSNASGKSKGKKSKESSLGRPKISNSPIQNKEEDVQSVHSTGSRHSNKSTKKQNTIMQKPKIQGPAKMKQEHGSYNNQAENKLSFKDAWRQQEQSVIKPYSPAEKASPIQNIGRQTNTNEKIQNQQKIQAKFSPFAEIQQQHNSDDEPVIQLLQPAEYTNKNGGIVGVKKSEQKQKVVAESRMMFDESNTVFGESKLRETKSRRRNIFQKSNINQNSSKVSNSIAESSISGLGDTSHRRSTSRRREIFNKSRQKQSDERSKNILQSQSNLISIGPLPFESKEIGSTFFKQAPSQNDRFKPLEKKVLGNDNDDFGLDESKSDLNLSASNHIGKDRDSLIFQFQPEKKKGMTIVSSKNTKTVEGNRDIQQNMLNLKKNNLTSVGQESERQMIKVNNNLVSRELQNVQKILSSNEQYLNKIQNFGSIDSYKPNKQIQNIEKNSGNTLNYNTGNNQRPWHQIVNEYQEHQVINIKTVQRNEKKISKPSEQKDNQAELIQRQKQRELQLSQKRQLEEQQKQNLLEIKKRKQQQQRQLQQLRKQQQERRMIQIKRNRQKQENEKRLAEKKRQEERKLKQKLETEKRIKEQQLQRQRQLIRQKDEEIIKLKQMQKQRLLKQKQFQRQQKLKLMQLKDTNIPKLTNIPSSLSKEESENNSEKSNKSNKKQKQKKQSSLNRQKNHKVYVKNQSPRAEESFYQSNVEPSEQEPSQNIKLDGEQRQDKKPKLLSFSDEQQDYKPKSRTDNNFYDYTRSQKSIKPPSSKPPLSKKSNGSGGSLSKEKRPKQKTIAITIKQQPIKKMISNNSQQQKKMSLMERAMMKHKQQSSNGSCSQDSFRNRQSYDSENSKKSNSSKNSKGSVKKQSTLSIKMKDTNMIYSKHGKAPLGRQSSHSSSHEEQMERIQKDNQAMIQQKQRVLQTNKIKQNIMNERVIVSKNCTFIDQRGRLVNKDLVIKGHQIYGIPSSNQNIDSTVLDRMKRSRNERRSRSKSRDKNKISRKLSRDGSQGESNNESSSYGGQSFYQNNSRGYIGNSKTNYTNDYYNNQNSNTLRQFIRPIEQVPMYEKVANKNEKNIYVQPVQPRTLNQMFSRKNSNLLNNNSMNQSRSRKSLGRTQKTFNKK